MCCIVLVTQSSSSVPQFLAARSPDINMLLSPSVFPPGRPGPSPLTARASRGSSVQVRQSDSEVSCEI